MENIKAYRQEKERWNKEKVTKSLSRFSERKKDFHTSSNIYVERVYDPLNLLNVDFLNDISYPGTFPFTRGIYPTMYRTRLWTIRQYAGFGTAEQTNQRFRYLLEQGQTGLSAAFDFPTQIGLDCNHSLAMGEVGKVGVSVGSLREMEILFNHIPLDKVTTSMTINAPAAVLLAMYIAIAQKKGIKESALGGTIQNDILKEYIARGMYIFPPKPSMKLVTDVFEFCSKNMPRWHTISISGYHIREAGATAVQEVAFTLANGISYVQAAVDCGLDINEFGRRLSFFFAANNNFLEEIAKFRAARRIWAKIMRERFGATNPVSWQLRFHTQTSGVALTAQQPQNNIVRVTLQALAAVLGGTQSLHTNSYDEAFTLPSQAAATIALRIQQIIGYESGISDTVDPLGGSFCIETLTNQIENEAEKYIEKVDRLGGAVTAIEKGYMQREITESAYRFQRDIEKKLRLIVGVNEFKSEEKIPIKITRVDPKIEKKVISRITHLKKERNKRSVQEALSKIHDAADIDKANLVPLILKAVKEYATLGEICNVLREVYGEYKPLTIF